MSPRESEVDVIDFALYGLARRANDGWEKTHSQDWRELAELIQQARAKSFMMLPRHRQEEVSG